ncbi:MAG TPA: hypothetical protein VE243_08090 [Candidatus Acidoferrum sp.]|nr:hypothetical protein [Candidatus Acidoferrum sp.]
MTKHVGKIATFAVGSAGTAGKRIALEPFVESLGGEIGQQLIAMYPQQLLHHHPLKCLAA